MKKILKLCFIFLFFSMSVVVVSANSYTYDYYSQIVSAPESYRQIKKIDSKALNNLQLRELQDIDILDDRVYILDARAGLIILDSNDQVVSRLNTFYDDENQEQSLNRPQSISVTTSYVYIADTQNFRIAIFSHFDEHGIFTYDLNFVKFIYLPVDVPSMSNIDFKPLNIDVDHMNRIFVVAADVYEGLLEFDFDGNFKQFVGTNKIEINLIEYFWRQLISKSAKDNLQLYLPVVFTSLAIDSAGFIYTTTSSTNINPIQKFNYKGEDVLVQNGNIPVIGDVFEDDENKTSFVSIDVNDYGIYLALDQTNKRIFAYNDSGELLYIIGNEGQKTDHFVFPVSVKWHNDQIFVVDQGAQTVFVYEPTTYGWNINEAVRKYYNGHLIESKSNWEEVLKLNTNNDLAYIGIGKVYYQQGLYKDAVDYFKLGNNKTYYTKAYAKYRNEVLRENFTWIGIGLLTLVAAVYIRNRGRKDEI